MWSSRRMIRARQEARARCGVGEPWAQHCPAAAGLGRVHWGGCRARGAQGSQADVRPQGTVVRLVDFSGF